MFSIQWTHGFRELEITQSEHLTESKVHPCVG
jgi:hypothetical protein